MKASQKKINFNAGPAAMPEEVLKQASEAVIDYDNKGLSILELPHRGKAFDNILEESQALVKELCGINDDYEVLWQQGGGRLQFAMIPMNFLAQNDTAGYIDSGHWAEEATQYAMYYGGVQILSTTKEEAYKRLPEWPDEMLNGLAYLHYTTNNTIYGTQFPEELPPCNVPLIADMSSDIFSRHRDYSRYSFFYATAQKNIGAAGVTLAVIRKDMLERTVRTLPPMLSYRAHVKQNSVLNTPPVFAIYTSLLMLRWMKAKGMDAIEKENKRKAALLYAEIERNTLFEPIVNRKADRSMMNVCFHGWSKEEEKAFVQYCESCGITGIAGHRSVGGFRASLYNAITLPQVEHLVTAMKDFEKQQIK